MKTVTRDYDIQNSNTVPVGIWNQQTSVEGSNYEEKCKNALIVPGELLLLF